MKDKIKSYKNFKEVFANKFRSTDTRRVKGLFRVWPIPLWRKVKCWKTAK